MLAIQGVQQQRLRMSQSGWTRVFKVFMFEIGRCQTLTRFRIGSQKVAREYGITRSPGGRTTSQTILWPPLWPWAFVRRAITPALPSATRSWSVCGRKVCRIGVIAGSEALASTIRRPLSWPCFHSCRLLVRAGSVKSSSRVRAPGRLTDVVVLRPQTAKTGSAGAGQSR